MIVVAERVALYGSIAVNVVNVALRHGLRSPDTTLAYRMMWSLAN